MCDFITLIVPTDDTKALIKALRRHGRKATPIDNPSVRAVLKSNEFQYLTAKGHCDCGTVLGYGNEIPDNKEDRLKKKFKRLKRKGWTETKIRRAIDDQKKVRAKQDNSGPDSFEFWSNLLRDVKQDLKLPYVGLFVSFYSGAVATENIETSRLNVPKNTEMLSALENMKSDEVTMFY